MRMFVLDLVGSSSQPLHQLWPGLELLALGQTVVSAGGGILDQDWLGAGCAEPGGRQHLISGHVQLCSQRLEPGVRSAEEESVQWLRWN